MIHRRSMVIIAIIIALFTVLPIMALAVTNDVRDFSAELRTVEPMEGAELAAHLYMCVEILEMRLGFYGYTDAEARVDGDIIRIEIRNSSDPREPTTLFERLIAPTELSFRDERGLVLIKGDDVDSASSGLDASSNRSFLVQLRLTPEGRAKFYEATKKNIGKTIGIYIGDKLVTEPTVQAAIDSEQMVINGIATAGEALSIANIINSGSMPLNLELQSTSAVRVVSSGLQIEPTGWWVALLQWIEWFIDIFR